MPTGPIHERLISAEFDEAGNLTRVEVEDCHCMIGSNHDDAGNEFGDWQDLQDGGGQSLSVYDAAAIWLSRGQDEDSRFGYSQDELRRAAGLS